MNNLQFQMAEEFEESEVIFQDHYKAVDGSDEEYEDGDIHDRDFESESRNKKAKKTNYKIKSAPVDIPWMRCAAAAADADLDAGEMVPPHVIVGRRVEGKMMAFSVCTGNGRTLKGRDLSELRNSVLRMTGFLET